MGDVMMHCPLCCGKIFGSKQLLVEHLLNIVSNLNCSLCSTTFSSLELLIDHLNHENCQQSKIEHSYTFVRAVHDDNELEKRNEKESFIENLEQNVPENQFEAQIEKADADGCKVSEMFVAVEPCTEIQLETQELKFVHDLGENRYMVLTSHDVITKAKDEVLTEQNDSETLSTDINDSETVITQSEKETENQEETYSCNNCGVSFTSVLEHIQNYHNDQDTVVVEQEQLEEEFNDETIQEVECLKKENDTEEKKPARRVITEAGNIVEAPFLVNISSQTQTTVPNENFNVSNGVMLQVQKEPVTKGKRINTKKYTQIDKFCDSVVKDIKNMEDNNGPFHKVILKEMQTLENGTKVKIYNCMSCNIYVSSLDEFKLHPCKTLIYHCPHCPVAYDNTKSLSAHMKVHKDTNAPIKYEPDVPGPVKCEICSTVFQTNKSLKLHKRMHDPVKARPIEPPVESAEGTEVSQDKFLCSVCDKLIPIDYRTVHQNSHKTSSKFHCDVCNKKFNSMEYLEMHMNVHNFEKSRVNRDDKVLPYSCAFCPRKFSRPHEKVKHERIHTGEKPHSCEICGKSFRVAYCLTLHMRTHTGARPYECPHCWKRFKAHSVYNHHLLTHSDVRAYKCPFCPKAFKTSVQLAGHKNSHTKPFSCQHCNRPFASLYAVRVHTETHLRQNNLKFSCSLCGASYARTFALKDHIKQVHNKELESSETSQSSSLTTAGLKDSGWMIEEQSETDEGIQSLKVLPDDEMNDLGMNSNEPESVMIVP